MPQIQYTAQQKIEGATAFMFDWGGYFGLRVAVDYPDMLSRLVLCTTGMPRANRYAVSGSAVWLPLR